MLRVGGAPKRTYRSASPEPPEIENDRFVAPDGTFIMKFVWLRRLPDRLVTGTPFCNSLLAGVDVDVGIGVFVAVATGVGVEVDVGVGVGVKVDVAPGEVGVGVNVLVPVGVRVGVGVLVPVAVGVGVFVAVAVGVGVPLVQDGNLNEPIRVLHGAVPVLGIYSVVNQKVQSSLGSIAIIE